jgi:hypothetical protein
MPNTSSHPTDLHNEKELISKILASKSSSEVVSTTLKTDQKVIARVTDGIYRQPGSALRELISNAYDADASRVVIKTDAPRFDRISVEDNGHGMSPQMLAHLLFHIGGSAKRSEIGKDLGVTSASDSLMSPGGRRLIGKIGIGLFSVSQLTYSFQIITKIKGEAHRTIATVALKQFTENIPSRGADEKGEFESGKVNIWREKASDLKSHGTTIVLTNIRPQARDTLRSREIWSAIEQNESLAEGEEERQAIEPPKFHIGRVDKTGELLKKTGGHFSTVPWDKSDSPEQSFSKLVDCVWDELLESNPNPQLERLFDYYLRMVWQLGLAVPLPYIDDHIFDIPLEGFADAFVLSNQTKGSARKLEPKKGETSRDSLNLIDKDNPGGKFEVFFDDLKLSRPIKFRDLPVSTHALKRPLVFLGKCQETFGKIPRELSGGPLEFEAYLFWTPKVAPTEHQGSLIRIHGSSGTLFDPTFMRYQVSEQTRLRQVTCEIFVHEGLDSALNIDRESFNNAHPHAVYITKWLHSALRQLATAQKRLAGGIREHRRDESTQHTASQIQKVANDIWAEEMDDLASPPPPVEFTESGKKTNSSADSYVYQRSAVVVDQGRTRTAKTKAHEIILEEKLKAIAQILASFGLLEAVSKKKQEKLLKAIYKILDTSEE